jgi:ankyrin repeat protein
LEAKADVNARNSEGMTALMLATDKPDALVRLLEKYGNLSGN